MSAACVLNRQPSGSEIFQNPAKWWEKALWTDDGSVRRWVDEATGIRFYPIEAPPEARERGQWVCVPGVTSVIGFFQSEDERDRLEIWRENEILAGRDPDRAKGRGTNVHGMLEDYVCGMPLRSHTYEEAVYYSGMTKHLKPYRGFLWNEKPLRRGWDHTWSAFPGESNRLARVWSWRWGYAGTPDLIGIYGTKTITLADFKTSDKYYVRRTGEIPLWQKTGWMKYTKTRLQLAAYDIAINETLKIQPTLHHIIVGMNEEGVAQQFFEYGPEVDREKERFKRMTLRFWDQVDFRNLKPAGPDS